MDEKDVQILLTLSNLKNFTHTANRLYISQPALTARIKRLEADLGVELFHRTTKGVQFTPTGETVVEYAKTLHATTRKMREHVKLSQTTVSGTIHLGCAAQYARYSLAKLLHPFLEEFPLVSVDVVSDRSINIQQDLSRNVFSVAIIRGDFKWQGVKHCLTTERYCLVYQHPITFDELKDIVYIRQKSDNQGQEKADRWVSTNLPFTPAARVESNSIDVCLSMVLNGFGWAILPEICLQDYTGFRTPIYFSDNSPILRDTYFCYKQSELEFPHIREFVRYIERTIITT